MGRVYPRPARSIGRPGTFSPRELRPMASWCGWLTTPWARVGLSLSGIMFDAPGAL